jgi:hypothetical protein
MEGVVRALTVVDLDDEVRPVAVGLAAQAILAASEQGEGAGRMGGISPYRRPASSVRMER